MSRGRKVGSENSNQWIDDCRPQPCVLGGDAVPLPRAGWQRAWEELTNVRLLPMRDYIGPHAVEHGERGTDMDPAHPLACLCGEPDYLTCPAYLSGDHIGSWTISLRAESDT